MFLTDELGKRMRYIRKKLGLSQRQIAESMGISINMYSSMELGTRKINLEHISLFSKCVGIPLTVLFSDCENEQLELEVKENDSDCERILQAFQMLDDIQKKEVVTFIENMINNDDSDSEEDIIIM